MVQWNTDDKLGRIENMTINDSNFVTTNDEGDATEVNFVRDQVVNVSRDSEGTNLKIPSDTRESMQYPNSYTGKMIGPKLCNF